MDKWFVGIAGLVLSVLIAVNNISIAFALLIVVCDGVMIYRNKQPDRLHFRLVLWGQLFGMLSVLVLDYLYITKLIDLQVYSVQRQLVARGFMAVGVFLGMCWCLYKMNGVNLK
mgnify:CR=1 FL=1